VHLPRLIDLKENQFRSAIDHGFISTENVEAKDAINVTAPRTRIARVTQGNENAAKTHATSCEILSKTQGEFLAIDFAKSDVTQTALRWLYAE
jgi:hypothetical protein